MNDWTNQWINQSMNPKDGHCEGTQSTDESAGLFQLRLVQVSTLSDILLSWEQSFTCYIYKVQRTRIENKTVVFKLLFSQTEMVSDIKSVFWRSEGWHHMTENIHLAHVCSEGKTDFRSHQETVPKLRHALLCPNIDRATIITFNKKNK